MRIEEEQRGNHSQHSLQRAAGPRTTRLTSFPPAGRHIAGGSRDVRQIECNAFGTPVVLEFWATWCAICRRQLPEMMKAHERYGDRVQFVLVNTAEGEDVVRTFVEKAHIAGTILLDPDDRVGELYGTRILPSIFFVDAAGTIQAANAGALRDVQSFMATMMKGPEDP